MKILIAPDAFKGSLTAMQVAEAIEKGIKRVHREINTIKLPLADGGEGTVQSLVDATDGCIIEKKVTGPLGSEVTAHYGLLGDGKTAVIEMATASGLPLVPENRRNPELTTTFGTGELIHAALDHELEKLIIGIGGSATNDAGIGMAQALGASFKDDDGYEVGFGGKALGNITSIDLSGLDKKINDIEILTACDVNNPLYGKQGAAYVYAPQKGADREMVERLDNNLRHFSSIVKKQLNEDISEIPGAGAAGGLGAGLVAFLGAELRSGFEIIKKVVNLGEKLKQVDLVITGEGQIDNQTITGKTPIGVARTSKQYNVPVIAICGKLGRDYKLVLEEGIDALFSIVNGPMNTKQALENAEELTINTGEQIMRTILVGEELF